MLYIISTHLHVFLCFPSVFVTTVTTPLDQVLVSTLFDTKVGCNEHASTQCKTPSLLEQAYDPRCVQLHIPPLHYSLHLISRVLLGCLSLKKKRRVEKECTPLERRFMINYLLFPSPPPTITYSTSHPLLLPIDHYDVTILTISNEKETIVCIKKSKFIRQNCRLVRHPAQTCFVHLG